MVRTGALCHSLIEWHTADTVAGTWDAVLIELNPYKDSTGGSLYHWTGDKEILFGPGADDDAGKDPR